MDDETLFNLSWMSVLGAFMLTWKYNPINPEFPIIYPGMIMPIDMILTYFVSIMMIVTTLFIWIFIGLRGME